MTDPSRLQLELSSGLRFETVRQGDRYRQSIAPSPDTPDHRRLRSLEGDDRDRWPPTPPLQQLTRETRGNSTVLLGVGMAGRSHWSVSILADGNRLLFDAACRVRGEPGFLGSTFELPSDVKLSPELSPGEELPPGEHPPTWRLVWPEAVVRLELGTGARLERSSTPNSERFAVVPNRWDATACWSYSFSGPVRPGEPLHRG